jgi:hypothetical protein
VLHPPHQRRARRNGRSRCQSRVYPWSALSGSFPERGSRASSASLFSLRTDGFRSPHEGMPPHPTASSCTSTPCTPHRNRHGLPCHDIAAALTVFDLNPLFKFRPILVTFGALPVLPHSSVASWTTCTPGSAHAYATATYFFSSLRGSLTTAQFINKVYRRRSTLPSAKMPARPSPASDSTTPGRTARAGDRCAAFPLNPSRFHALGDRP